MKKLAAIFAVLAPLSALAGPNLITDGSFEQGTFAPTGNASMSLPVSDTSIAGWVVISNSIMWIGSSNPYSLSASDGLNFLDLTDSRSGAPFGGVQQTIPTTVGVSYVLSLDVGSSGPYGVPVGVRATAGNVAQDFFVSSQASNIWTPFSLGFTATSTSTVITLSGIAGVYYTGLDNVSVSAVPEPRWFVTMMPGLAIVGFLGLRRKRGVDSPFA